MTLIKKLNCVFMLFYACETTHMNVIVNGRECNSDKEWNNNKCQCKFKNPKNIVCGKNFIFWILLYVVAKMAYI